MSRRRARPGRAAALVLAWAACAATQAADPKTEAVLSTVCITCHGADGQGISDQFPKLAGQTREYVLKQLGDFLSGKRKNAVMTPFLPQLKTAKLPELAGHYAALPAPMGKPADEALAARGKDLYDNGKLDAGIPGCVGCHGPGAVGAELNPRLAGQYASYLTAQMQAFRSGERNNDAARVMRSAATGLSDADIEALSAYLGSL